MTNKLEKQFFDTFGIEPKPIYSGSKLYNPFVTGYDYPTISDRILLELICICKQIVMISDFFMYRPSIEELKNNVLKNLINQDLINFKKIDIKHQVRTLFEER